MLAPPVDFQCTFACSFICCQVSLEPLQCLPASVRTTPGFTATWEILLALSRSELFTQSSAARSFIDHFRALDDSFVSLNVLSPAEDACPTDPWVISPFLDVSNLLKHELDWNAVLTQHNYLHEPGKARPITEFTYNVAAMPKTETVVFDVIASWLAAGRCNVDSTTLNLKQAAYLLLAGVWLQNCLNQSWGFRCTNQRFQTSLLIGGPGTGKTYITNVVKELVDLFLPHSTCQAAYTHRASRLVDGTTLHSCLGLHADASSNQCYQNLGNRKETLQAFWQPIQAFFIDEVSMVSKEFLAQIEHRCRLVKNQPNAWGELSLRLSGCFHQLPPVAASSLIQNLPAPLADETKPHTLAGHELWGSLTTVIHLDVSRRCHGQLNAFLKDLLADKGISDTNWNFLLRQCLRPKDPRLELPEFGAATCAVGVLRHSVRALKTLQRAQEAAAASGHRLVLAVAADRQASATKGLTLDPTLALHAASVHNLSATMNLPGLLCLYPGVSLGLEAKLCTELGLVRGCPILLEKIIFADAEPFLVCIYFLPSHFLLQLRFYTFPILCRNPIACCLHPRLYALKLSACTIKSFLLSAV